MAEIALPKCEFITAEDGRIVQVKAGAAVIDVAWRKIEAALIPYANFVICEVCNNRGIATPSGATE